MFVKYEENYVELKTSNNKHICAGPCVFRSKRNENVEAGINVSVQWKRILFELHIMKAL